MRIQILILGFKGLSNKTATATATAAKKTSLKKRSRAASKFIALIPTRLIRLMLTNFFGVEF